MRATIFCCVVFLLAEGGVASYANQVFTRVTPFVLCGNTTRYSTVSGNIVIWEDYRSGNMDIYGKNLITMEEFEVCTGLSTQFSPSIDGNFVAWVDDRNGNRDIYGKNLATGEEIPIDLSPYNVWKPGVSGNFVVWSDWRPADGGNPAYGNILGKNWVTGEEFMICGNNGTTHQGMPVISGNIVVWMDRRNGNYDIYGKNIATGEDLTISVGPGEKLYPAIDGNIVVWQRNLYGNNDIYGKNLITGEEFIVCDHWSTQNSPSIGGNYVVWYDNRNGTNYGLDIYGYNLLTGEEFPIWVGPGDQYASQVDNYIVVWSEVYTGTPPRSVTFGAYIGTVPEPGTLALIAPAIMGLAGIFFRKMRK